MKILINDGIAPEGEKILLDAGLEVELASYTSADKLDIVMTGGLLHNAIQSDVNVTSSLFSTDGSH